MAAGLAVAVVVLVGCSPHGSVAPSVAATAASPTPTLPAPVASPTRPAGWADSGEVGAAAAAVWFVEDLYPYVLETNDSATWQALSEPDCQWCASTTAKAADHAAAGQVLRGGAVTTTVTQWHELNPLAYSVVLRVDQDAVSRVTLGGDAVSATPAESGQALVIVLRAGDQWHLRAAQWFGLSDPVPTPSVAP